MKPFHRVTKFLLSMALCAGLIGAAQAQQDERSVGGGVPANPVDPVDTFLGAPDLSGLLFVGTSQNSSTPGDALNDVFSVDPGTGSATSIYMNAHVWGATADPANSRILFTQSSGQIANGGDELFAVPYTGGAPVSLGLITNSAGGAGQRMDGLAMSGGQLYGFEAGAGATNGFYSIDLGTLVATMIGTNTDSISGLDADPDTGIIYGTNDTAGQLVSIDPGTGMATNVVAYPAGYTDVDGLAVGNGMAYLITDESQDIQVYDIGGGSFVGTLPSPFAAADVFSGGAIATAGGPPPPPAIIPTLDRFGLILLVLALMVGVFFGMRRRARQ